MTIISSVLTADRRLIGVRINRLRKAVNRLRRYTPAEDFGAEARACKRTAEGFGQEADWLEELKRYRDLEEQGRLLDAADNAEIYSIIRRKKERWLKRLEG